MNEGVDGAFDAGGTGLGSLCLVRGGFRAGEVAGVGSMEAERTGGGRGRRRVAVVAVGVGLDGYMVFFFFGRGRGGEDCF